MNRPRKSQWTRPRKASTFPGVAPMKESVFQSQVGQYARARGALHYHTYNSERSDAGFPDSVILGNWIMFLELKSDSDSARVSDKQKTWIQRLKDRGYDADVYWPADWESGELQNRINACTRRRVTRRDRLVQIEDLAKTLYLFTTAGAEPAAGLMWDAGAKGVDRVRWQVNAERLMRDVTAQLPRTDEEIVDWLRAHRLGPGAGPGAVLAALRADLTCVIDELT